MTTTIDHTGEPARDALTPAILRLRRPDRADGTLSSQSAAKQILAAVLARDTAREPEARLITYAEDRALQAFVDLPIDNDAGMAWIESRLTLHEGVEFLYVVDGYEVRRTSQDGGQIDAEYHGETLEEAVHAARVASSPKTSRPPAPRTLPVPVANETAQLRLALRAAQRALQMIASQTTLGSAVHRTEVSEAEARRSLAASASTAALATLEAFGAAPE